MSEERAEIGQPAPDFEGEAIRWNPRKKEFEYLVVNLAQNRKRSLWTVLFFYPRDFSGLCPTEIHAFNRRLADFEQAGAQVIGCSTDSKQSNQAWMERPRTRGGIDKLGYPLLEDPSLRISRAYGVLDERAGMALRGSFIIDDEGVVRAYSVYPAGTGRNIDEIVRLLQALQTGKACPAGWRPGRKTL